MADRRRVAEATRRAAFRWSFGVCAGAPFAAVIVGTVLGWDAMPYGFYGLFYVVYLWIGVALAGLLLMVFDHARGAGTLLGALAGAVIGFGGCSAVAILVGLVAGG